MQLNKDDKIKILKTLEMFKGYELKTTQSLYGS